MKKLIRFIEKNYIYVNITLLFFMIYIILFPIISIPIKQIAPIFGECTYLRTTGKECPLCGGTRYIQNLPHNIINEGISYLYHPFGLIVIFILLETIFRITTIFRTKKIKNKEKYVKIDLTIHLIILIIFNLYELIFLISNK